MVNLNDSLLCQTSMAALMVIGGVVVKNSSEKLGLSDHKVAKPLGMGLFTFGWLFAAYVLTKGRSDRLPLASASIAILVSVMAMKMCNEEGKSPGKIFPYMFGAAWLLLGYSVGDHMKGNMRYFGLLASLLALGSLMVVLPRERKECLVDGPGMPMFVISWAIIVYLNSAR